MWLEGLGKLKKSTSSGTRTGDLPACSTVSQPTALLHALKWTGTFINLYLNNLNGFSWFLIFTFAVVFHSC
jgi:hypothetical protein